MEGKYGREERFTKWQSGRRGRKEGGRRGKEEQIHTEVLLISEYC